MSKIVDIADYRRKRDLQALRLTAGIAQREQRIREHEEAMIAINKFYGADDEISD